MFLWTSQPLYLRERSRSASFHSAGVCDLAHDETDSVIEVAEDEVAEDMVAAKHSLTSRLVLICRLM
jgi:hypothetical protein